MENLDESCTEEEAKEYIRTQLKKPLDPGTIYGRLVDIVVNDENKCYIILQRYSNDSHFLEILRDIFKDKEIKIKFFLNK